MKRAATLAAIAALPVLVAAAIASGCSAAAPETETQGDAVRNVERKIIGLAKEYPADLSMRRSLDALNGSMKARREAAWKAVAKVLQPVQIAETGVDAGGVDSKIPLFRTWYGKDDLARMFGKAYTDLGKEGRQARRPFNQKEIDAVFQWNATDQGSWTNDDYLARVRRVTDTEFLNGLGGNSRVSYSPGFSRHLFSDYKAIYECLPKLATFQPQAEPPSEQNFSPCMSEEFPVDAAIIKASWWRADFNFDRADGGDGGSGSTLPVFDTSADSIRKRRTGESDNGGWGRPTLQARPDPSKIYTVKTGDGTAFRLPGIHLSTKELREWLWITLWWSADPDTDFGADRPQAIKDLGGPWGNYKMCVVTSYEEGDEDPRGGFDGSLGDALEAMHEGKGGPTWCSNPYVEKGVKNAQTNCIGCHQHAGVPTLSSEDVLAREADYPKAGRTRIRKNFPADYAWAFDFRPEFVARIIETQVSHFDSVE